MIQYTGVDYKAERVPPVSGVNLFFFLLYSQESTPTDPRPLRRSPVAPQILRLRLV